MNQIDAGLWFAMVKDEADLEYAAEQLRQDYGDLRAALGDRRPDESISDPSVAASVKREVLDVLWDYAWLRDRSRRLVGRACWFLSEGPKFLSLSQFLRSRPNTIRTSIGFGKRKRPMNKSRSAERIATPC